MTDTKRAMTAGGMVAALTLLLFAGSLSCGFINLDDPYYVTNNPGIKSLELSAIGRIFSASHLGTWLPLTYVSFAIDYHFWGENPFGYHLTNIVLHAANAFLVVLLMNRLLHCWRRGGAGEGGSRYSLILILGGLLWSIHPLRVESVAWVAERKDVLNGLFTIAATLAYLRYAEYREAGRGYRFPYLLSLALFVCSLLAKQVSVTLPIILLLLDWYPLGRLARDRVVPVLLEKVPFCLVSVLLTVITIYFAAAEKMLSSMQDLPFYVRVLVSGNAIFEYCRLSLFPVGISPYFVLPKPLPSSYLATTAVVAAVTILLFSTGKRRPAQTVVWFAFVTLLLPMLAFVQAGDDIALAARYTYLPAIALCSAAAAVLLLLCRRVQSYGRCHLSIVLSLSLAAYVAFYAVINMKLIKVWHDTASFWSRVIEIQPVGRAYGDRGVYYLINGKSAAAVDDFSAAITIAVKSKLKTIYNLYAFRGVALSDVGRFTEALDDLDRAIALYPHPTYFQQRGLVLRALGRGVEAEEDLRRAGADPPPIEWFE